MFSSCYRAISATAASSLSLLVAAPAFAHHGMDDALPRTPVEGLVSGLLHPALDVFHLGFLVALGALLLRREPGRVSAMGTFLAATLVGCVAQAQGAGWPLLSDAPLAGTWAALGAACFLSRGSSGWVTLLVGVSGLVHGAAYGALMRGAPAAALSGHVAGLSASQLVIALTAAWLSTRALPRQAPARRAAPAL